MRIKGCLITAAVAAIALNSTGALTAKVARTPVATFSLVHAIGSEERVVARGIDKYECQSRKKEYAKVALYTGARGSVTCIPDKLD
jgi:hypothetical protein